MGDHETVSGASVVMRCSLAPRHEDFARRGQNGWCEGGGVGTLSYVINSCAFEWGFTGIPRKIFQSGVLFRRGHKTLLVRWYGGIEGNGSRIGLGVVVDTAGTAGRSFLFLIWCVKRSRGFVGG